MKVFTRTDAHSRGRISKSYLMKGLSLLFVSSFIVASTTVVSNADSSQRWNLGSAINTGKDNGFSGSNTIDRDDPHYGWSLGQFYVSGYTQRTTDTDGDVFLKNVGDQVELHFELLQDIDCLNGNSNLSIYADENGYDQYFSTQQYNDCRGLLIIRKIDYQNATADPVIYTDYLDGVAQGADTVVELCEEGDYEVALDYEIKEEHYGASWNTYVSVPTYTNYRIFFTFKIRNGNCMVFPFDCSTGSELQNESFTENGFYLDLANSRYLEINVQRSLFVEGSNGYTEDVRFNRPAADGTEYTDEGVYTITVRNLYTNQTTTKVIYVGTDPMMMAYVIYGYSLDELQDLIEEGYQITDDGILIAPITEEEEIETTVAEVVEENGAIETEAIVEETVVDEPVVEEEPASEPQKKGGGAIPVIVVLVFIIGGAGAFVYFKKELVLSTIKSLTDKTKKDTISSSAANTETTSEALEIVEDGDPGELDIDQDTATIDDSTEPISKDEFIEDEEAMGDDEQQEGE